MKRAVGIFFSFALIVGALAIAIAKQYAGATFQDIMSAMGPDALGLEISADKLPDIATLKESRMDDQSQKFIVDHPYTGGHWKGGRARVEYARDLSYALISIYDKEGKRQRIYSVKARPSEQEDDLASAVNAAGHTSSRPSSSQAALPDVEVVQTPQAVSPPSSTSTPPPAPTSSKKRHHKHSQVPIEVATANTTSGAPVWVPVAQPAEAANPAPSAVKVPVQAPPPASKSAAASEAVPQSPVAGFVWDENLGAYVPAAGSGSSNDHSSKRKHGHPAAEPPLPDLQETVPVVTAAPANSVSSAQTMPAKVVAAEVPSTDELLGTNSNSNSSTAEPAPVPAPEPKHSKKGRKTVQSSPEEMPSAQTPVESVPPPAPAPPVVSKDDQDLIAKAKKDLQAAEASSASAQQSAAEATTPPSNTGPTGPDTSESDRWVPKATKVVPAPEPVIPQPVKVAMLPKAAPPPDASIDNLLKIAGQNPAAAAADSDAWVPKNTKLPKADADVIAELNRIKAQKPVPVPVVKVNRDINNPEEGVLPANSFEKFVGPRYGRHREYERRLMFGKKPKSTVKEYDFYVDEVDRKKEIHNVYYYKKGKIPKLVAVEKHYSVTFLSNYDVDKEDKGKISLE